MRNGEHVQIRGDGELIQGHKSQRRIESKIRLITKAAGGPAIEVEPVPRRGIEAVEPGAVAGAQGTIEENARRERQRGGGINKTERVGIGLSSGGINLDLVIAGRKIEQRVSFVAVRTIDGPSVDHHARRAGEGPGERNIRQRIEEQPHRRGEGELMETALPGDRDVARHRLGNREGIRGVHDGLQEKEEVPVRARVDVAPFHGEQVAAGVRHGEYIEVRRDGELLKDHMAQRRMKPEIGIVIEPRARTAIEVEPIARAGTEPVEHGAVGRCQGPADESARREGHGAGSVQETEGVAASLVGRSIHIDHVITCRKVEQ